MKSLQSVIPLMSINPKQFTALSERMNSKARAQYEDTFSVANWNAVNAYDAEERAHTVKLWRLSGALLCHSSKRLKEALIESGVKTK